MRVVITAVLLASGVAIVLLAGVGMLVVRDALDRLHLVTLAATPGTILIVASIFVARGFGQTAFAALLIGAIQVVTSAVLASATARAVLATRAGQERTAP